MYIINVSGLDNDQCNDVLYEMYGKRGYSFTVQETISYYDGVNIARDKRFVFLYEETARLVYKELKAYFNRDFTAYHEEYGGVSEIELD